MKRIGKPFILTISLLTLTFLLTACAPGQGAVRLEIEEHALLDLGDADMGDWTPVEDNRQEILARHQDLRETSATAGVSALTLAGDRLVATENYDQKYVSVIITRNDEQVYQTDAGVISPIDNFRGLWAVNEQWFMEVAHVEENPDDPNAAFIVWGEIIRDGDSLNKKYGYSEAFNFQLLDGKPFFLFIKDGSAGFSYDGRETDLDFEKITHYQCCSASSFNPRPSSTMVSFFARRGDVDYYVEVGKFTKK